MGNAKIRSWTVSSSSNSLSCLGLCVVWGDDLEDGEASCQQAVFQTAMTEQGGMLETLEDVPAHVWKGLPEDMSLKRSAVNQKRIGA